MVGGLFYFLCIEWNVVRHVEWHVRSSDRLRDYDLFVRFDCNFKATLAKDIAKILLNFRPMQGNPRESWIHAVTPDSTDQTLDSGLTYMG